MGWLTTCPQKTRRQAGGSAVRVRVRAKVRAKVRDGDGAAWHGMVNGVQCDSGARACESGKLWGLDLGGEEASWEEASWEEASWERQATSHAYTITILRVCTGARARCQGCEHEMACREMGGRQWQSRGVGVARLDATDRDALESARVGGVWCGRM